MYIPDAWAPLIISGIKDAVQFNRELLRSDTLRNRTDYEEHLLALSQFFEYLKVEYRKVEAAAGIPLEKLVGEE